MYIVYDQDYDDLTFIGYANSEEEAKEYAEYFKFQYSYVDSLNKKEFWPEKITYYNATARINYKTIELEKEIFGPITCIVSNNIEKQGAKILSHYIGYISYSSKEDAEENLNKLLTKYRIAHKPTKSGKIVSEFVLC